jgi:hypothetical protein
MEKNYLLFFVIILSFLGCEDDNPVSPKNESPEVIMSLKVGNQWTFIDSTFAENDSLISVDSSKLGITGKATINLEGKNIEVFY